MGRPRKYASAAEKQAAYRNRYTIVEARLVPETAETLDRIAEALDVPRTEVVNSMINFALLNRNWFTLGLFGKRLPYQKNPDPLFEWLYLGQKGLTKTHALYYLEKPDDKGTGRAMKYGTVTMFDGSSGWQVNDDGKRYKSLSEAKSRCL